MSETQRLIRNLLAAYGRIDRALNTGRNSDSTYRTIAWNWGRLQTALTAGGWEELDSNSRLAASYHKLERRHLLGN